MVSTLLTRDSRVLAYEEFGDPNGKPVIALHGTPGSRMGPHPRASRLYPHQVRLIAYDRPGYGESERFEGRAVADAAHDVEDLADALGIERFAVVGRSGGGPHALACAALLPARVTRVAALASWAPRELMDDRWYEDMAENNVDWFRKAELGIAEYTAYVAEEMNRRRSHPESVMPHHHSKLPKADRAMVTDYGIRSKLVDTFAEALRKGVDGWIDDNLAVVSRWGFELSRTSVPVLLWHGAQDVLAPVGHSRVLARAIPKAQLQLVRGAHLSAIKALPSVLPWLIEDSDRPLGSRRPDAA
jgi:pimeloyl-ACP methyl ester carboxylesterase